MNNFHPNFPWGKGMWIHDIGDATKGELKVLSKFDGNGNLLHAATFTDIRVKLVANGFSYVLIKTGDGDELYPGGNSQLTADMVIECHAAGLKVYSWSYVYGADPVREADLVLYAIEQLGVDGHVFDAEAEYERLPNPGQSAETTLKIVREKYPDFFLAHAPFPIIDYHTAFPYQVFGKYCDAVMPQMYWNDIGIDIQTMIVDTFNQWSKWQNSWQASGHADSIKPIIPLGMSYDIIDKTPASIMTPEQLTEFIIGVGGYGSVNFWVMEYTQRDDLWTALKNAPVKPRELVDTSLASSPNATPAQPGTAAASTPATDSNNQTLQTANNQAQPATPAAQIPTTAKETTTSLPTSKPFTAPAVINIKEDKTSPSGVKMEVLDHKPHIDYIIEFFTWLFSQLLKSRGGEKK